jgi:hypothetical protein
MEQIPRLSQAQTTAAQANNLIKDLDPELAG